MYRPIFILGIVSVICQLQLTLAVETTQDVKSAQQEDYPEGQLKLYSPILVNPDEFQYRGKLYEAVCPSINPSFEKADFFTAFRNCMKNGLRLARDASPEDTQKLTEIIRAVRQEVWLAGTNLGSPHSWYWLSTLSSVGEINDYRNWLLGAPLGNGQCMAARIIRRTGKMRWYTKDCDDALCYICEKNLT